MEEFLIIRLIIYSTFGAPASGHRRCPVSPVVKLGNGPDTNQQQSRRTVLRLDKPGGKMKAFIGLVVAALVAVGAPARADDPPADGAAAAPQENAAPDAAAPAAAGGDASAAPAPSSPPATPPANPAPVPAAEHQDGVCALKPIHQQLVAAEKAIRGSPAFHHASGHYRQALALISHAMKQLNHGCAAFKHAKAGGAANAKPARHGKKQR
jgi:hypothetical protein